MKYDCIILAAGLSSRMGKWKPELEINNIPIIRQSVLNASVHCGRIIVVGGYNFDKIEPLLKGVPDLILVNNQNYRNGMLTSVKTALNSVSTGHFFIALADMPFISPDTFLKMSASRTEDALFPVYKGRRGHPVLVSRQLIPRIISSPDSLMMKDVLRGRNTDEIEVDDPGIHKDLDKPEDIERNIKKS